MDLDTLSITNRFKLLKVLGGKCRICSIDEIKHLEIDHIHNDGADERTKYGSSEKIWGWYLEHQDLAFRQLQPLCKEHHELKHHPIILQNPKSIPKQQMQLFMDTLRGLEGDNKTSVKEEILIKELEKSELFTLEDESKNYIRRMLREASIWESEPICYNAV